MNTDLLLSLGVPLVLVLVLVGIFSSGARAERKRLELDLQAREKRKERFLGDAKLGWSVDREDDEILVLAARAHERAVELRLHRHIGRLHAAVGSWPFDDNASLILPRPFGRDQLDLANAERDDHAATIGDNKAWVLWSNKGGARKRALALPDSMRLYFDAQSETLLKLPGVGLDGFGVFCAAPPEPGEVFEGRLAALCAAAAELEGVLRGQPRTPPPTANGEAEPTAAPEEPPPREPSEPGSDA